MYVNVYKKVSTSTLGTVASVCLVALVYVLASLVAELFHCQWELHLLRTVVSSLSAVFMACFLLHATCCDLNETMKDNMIMLILHFVGE